MKNFIFLFLILSLCSCVEKNNITDVIDKSENYFERVNYEVLILDDDFKILELNTYYEDNILNSSISYNKDGTINYDKSFYLNLYPSENLLNFNTDSLIYIKYNYWRVIDSLNLFVQYSSPDNEILFNDTISLSSKKNGFLYSIKKIDILNYTLNFQLSIWEYSSDKPKTPIGMRIEKVKWITTKKTEPNKLNRFFSK